jgi:hypothetical protein
MGGRDGRIMEASLGKKIVTENLSQKSKCMSVIPVTGQMK